MDLNSFRFQTYFLLITVSYLFHIKIYYAAFITQNTNHNLTLDMQAYTTPLLFIDSKFSLSYFFSRSFIYNFICDLSNNAIRESSLYSVECWDDRWFINELEIISKVQPWPYLSYDPGTCLEGVPAEIRTGNPPETSMKRYHFKQFVPVTLSNATVKYHSLHIKTVQTFRTRGPKFRL
jgi:hypothetical protein